MAFAETANLAVKLTLGGNFTSQMAKARSSLRSFDKESRGFRAGAQIGTGIKRSAILVVAGVTAMAGALAIAVKEGQEAANVQKIYQQAIKTSGKVTQDNVTALNAQADALKNLAGIDDELIKSEQTRLIQMGLSGKAVEKLTPLILDASKATGKDLLTVTVAAGKAANGNATALQRLGIQVDKVRFKADPLAETMRVLNKRFGGTTQALSGQFDTRLGALRENLKNIREDVGIKLLPALTRVVNTVGTKLVPAFGKFVDRILPDISRGLDEFASALENGGAENAIRGITDALGPMIDLVKVAAAPVKAIVGAFLSLPKEVQTVLVGAFAVNKLTGGLVTNAAGGIIEAIGKGLLGGVKAPLVNVTGGVVNVNGGAGGAGDLLGTAAKGGILAAATSIATGIAAAAGIIVGAKVVTDAIDPGLGRAVNHEPGAGTPLGNRDPRRLNSNGQVVRNVLPPQFAQTIGHAVAAAIRDHDSGPQRTNEQTKDRDQVPARQATVKVPAKLDALQAKAQQTAAAVKDMDSSVVNSTSAAAARTVAGQNNAAARTVAGQYGAAGQIVAAVNGVIAAVNGIHISATSVNKTTTVVQRYGPPSGTRDSPARDGDKER